ncbi:hypothetical protein HDU67_008735, partial [Dinochytrium kinnereticum]
MIILFCLFITSCGVSHLVAAWMYWMETKIFLAFVKGVTALVSCMTACILYFAIPSALKIPMHVKAMELEITERALTERRLRNENAYINTFREIVHNTRSTLDRQIIMRTAIQDICVKLKGLRNLHFRCVVHYTSRRSTSPTRPVHIPTPPVPIATQNPHCGSCPSQWTCPDSIVLPDIEDIGCKTDPMTAVPSVDSGAGDSTRSEDGIEVTLRPHQVAALMASPVWVIQEGMGGAENDNLEALFTAWGDDGEGSSHLGTGGGGIKDRALILAKIDLWDGRWGMIGLIVPRGRVNGDPNLLFGSPASSRGDVPSPVTHLTSTPPPIPASDMWTNQEGDEENLPSPAPTTSRLRSWSSFATSWVRQFGKFRAHWNSPSDEEEALNWPPDHDELGHPGSEYMERLLRRDPDPPGMTLPGPSVVRGSEMPINAMSCFLGDVAEQVGIALQQANLMEQVRLRIRQLGEKNEALMRARKEVKVAQAQKDFTAVMSHEMRTPLFAISALSSMIIEIVELQTSGNPDRQRSMEDALEMMRVVKKSGDMLVSIVNNILDFAKYEEEPFCLDRTPFLIREAIETASEIVALQDSDGKFPQIMTFISASVPPVVVGDVTRFRQILVNILSNACKFTQSDGEVVVKVRLGERGLGDGEEGWVRVFVEVIDTGIGIRPEHAGMLFEKFTQADASITRKYGGTGLGLAIAKRLCNLMKGDISVSPNPEGKGTQFSLDVCFEQFRVDEWEPGLHPKVVGLGDRAFEGVVVGVVDGRGKGVEEIREKYPTPFHALLIDYQTILSTDETSHLTRLTTSPHLGPRIAVLCTTRNHRGCRQSRTDADASHMISRPIKLDHLVGLLRSVVTSGMEKGGVEGGGGVRVEVDGGVRSLPRLSILVVEDNRVNQMVIGKMLVRLGQEFEVAENGVVALEMVGEGGRGYDVVFM